MTDLEFEQVIRDPALRQCDFRTRQGAGSIAHREPSGACEGLKQRAMSSAEARLLGHEAGLGQDCGQFLIDGGALQ